MSDFELLIDYNKRKIRLTDERWEHIVSHIEMVEQRERLVQTLAEPDSVVSTEADPTVLVYVRFYEITPVTSKYLQVAVKMLEGDAFVVTAFFSRRAKKGEVVWQK